MTMTVAELKQLLETLPDEMELGAEADMADSKEILSRLQEMGAELEEGRQSIDQLRGKLVGQTGTVDQLEGMFETLVEGCRQAADALDGYRISEAREILADILDEGEGDDGAIEH